MSARASAAIRPAARARDFLCACFATPVNAAVSVTILVAAGCAIVPFLRWAVFDAVWAGASGVDCEGRGACWIFIGMRFDQIMYGSYPAELRWRVDLAGLAGVLGVAALALTPARPGKLKTGSASCGARGCGK